MRHFLIASGIAVVSICLIAWTGCGREQSNGPAAGEPAAADAHAHDHGHEGPHGGHIIELGAEDYHAELTHDEQSPTVGVYLLGGDAKTNKPIDADSVMINVAVDGESSQYMLPAVPQSQDAEGRSSYFELESEPLHVVVSGQSEAKNTHARLNITIDGKPYVGLIETEQHDHDHDHDHAH